MHTMAPSLQLLRRTYFGLVISIGSLILLQSAYDLIRNPIPIGLYVLAALTIISGSARLAIPSMKGAVASTSISDTFIITGALVFGPAAGIAIAELDGLVMSYTLPPAASSPSGRSALRLLFNITAPAIAVWLPANVFLLLAGAPASSFDGLTTGRLLIGLGAFACLYFIVNTGLVAMAVAIERHVPVIAFWREHFAGLWLTYFGGTSVGGALAFLWHTRNVDFQMLGVLVPLPIVLYYMFKHALGRTQDQITHLGEVNRLYLATIEALAHAIDAKDQVTHGHIRRVQREAVRLAEHLGIHDEKEIKAIEAAALLHDMGKLAVPEHILNKPGRLSPAEFEIMKRHAPIGAEILSGIDFPYPVVPIVRHHHENWDGTGYPDGISGEQIPIGARILSVVDCFDALTSDRPYRPRMTTDEAMEIVVQRRGSMYDPRVVDAFRKIHAHFTPDEQDSAPPKRIMSATRDDVAARASVDEGDSEVNRLIAAYDLGRALADSTELGGIAPVVHQHLEKHMPVATLAIYVYDQLSDALVLRDASSNDMRLLGDYRVRLGEGVSGWTAANCRPMMNADPRLELQEHAAHFSPALQSCLAVPYMHADGTVAGVVVVYATTSDAFRDAHRRLLEAVASRLGSLLQSVALTTRPLPVSPRNTIIQNRTA
jgi:putative nucleotidyltransferase with HDIG domain